jgi:AcrR family transcriptional regulator
MTEPQRERILSSACELYLRDGLDGFSMRKLARAVGVTAPALYRHFPSKEAVLLDVVREAYQRFSQHLYRALEGRTAAERFFLAGQGYLDFALENPRLYDMLYASPDQMGCMGLPPEVEAQACAVGQFWNDRVRECMDDGLLRRGDPRDASVTLWGHAHGLMALYLRGALRIDESGFRTLFRNSYRRLLAGLACPEFGQQLLEDRRQDRDDEAARSPRGAGNVTEARAR